MQDLCGLQGIYDLFNCKTPGLLGFRINYQMTIVIKYRLIVAEYLAAPGSGWELLCGCHKHHLL